jgi:hypothetical protein
MPVHRKVERTPNPWIVERFLLVVDPDSLDHALIECCGGHAWSGLCLARGHRIDNARVVNAIGQHGRSELWGERNKVIELDTVKVRQVLVPVVLLLFHHPDFVLDPSHRLERARSRDVRYLA